MNSVELKSAYYVSQCVLPSTPQVSAPATLDGKSNSLQAEEVPELCLSRNITSLTVTPLVTASKISDDNTFEVSSQIDSPEPSDDVSYLKTSSDNVNTVPSVTSSATTNALTNDEYQNP